MNNKNTNPVACYQHGECTIIESRIPETAKRMVMHGSENTYKLADSETTGNHHLLEMSPTVELFEDGDKVFMMNSEPAKVRCVMSERHDTIEIPAGEWEFGIAQEYDYLTESKRNVAD